MTDLKNEKKWFQFKELSAGKNRLILSYYLYKMLGPFSLRIIAFFVVLVTFLGAKEQKNASMKYFKILGQYTGKSFSPLYFSSLKQFLNYGNSLVDKIITFSGNNDPKNFHFVNEDDISQINELLDKKKGIFFVATHIGNVEIMRSLLQSGDLKQPVKVNIFMDKDFCRIFKDFLKNIETKSDTETHSLEDVGFDTGVMLSEKLDKGEIVFMAGDRIAKTNPEKTYSADFLNKKINLPVGAPKLAIMLKAPIYFVVCAKNNKRYDICTHKLEYEHLNKKEALEKFKTEYSAFLEECTVKYPYQYFNFFDMFEN